MTKNLTADNTVLCIVDIGGNSIKLESKMASGDTPNNKHKLLFKKLKNYCSLAQSISETGSMSAESMDCALSTLERIEDRIETIKDLGYNVVVKAIGTAPFRDAKNGAELEQRIENETNLPLKIIKGKKEAEYAAQGVIEKFPNISAIIVDVGGGSADFALVENGKITRTHGLPLGNLRIKFSDDPATFIQEHLDKLPSAFKNSDLPLIATGGTFRTISKSFSGTYTQHEMDQGQEINISKLSKYTQSIAYAISHNTSTDSQNLANHFNIKEARLPLVEPAAMLLDHMKTTLDIKTIMLSSASMRDGIRYEMRQDLEKKSSKHRSPANTNYAEQPQMKIA